MEVVYWRGRAKAHFVVAGLVGGIGVALSYGIGYGVLTLDPHLSLALILLSLWRVVLGLRAMHKGSVLPGDLVDAFWETWGKWHYLSMRLSQSSGRAARERAYSTSSPDAASGPRYGRLSRVLR